MFGFCSVENRAVLTLAGRRAGRTCRKNESGGVGEALKNKIVKKSKNERFHA